MRKKNLINDDIDNMTDLVPCLDELSTHHQEGTATEEEVIAALESLALGKAQKVKHTIKQGSNAMFGTFREETIEITKLPPNPQAAAFWLKNRGTNFTDSIEVEQKISWNETKTYENPTHNRFLENEKPKGPLLPAKKESKQDD